MRRSRSAGSQRSRAKHATLAADLGSRTGGALVFYFTDAPTTRSSTSFMARRRLSAWTWIAVFAGTTYGLAGFARDQVCTFMCPWPRLQGAIWDPEAYDRQLPRLSGRTAHLCEEGH